PGTVSRMPRLPLEILTEIFMYLTGQQRTLQQILIVCKQWSMCVVPALYHSPLFKDTFRWANFLIHMTRKGNAFDYCSYITTLDLSSGAHIDDMLLNHCTEYIHMELHELIPDGRNCMVFYKGASHINVSTSSLLQIANSCSRLTTLNLTNTELTIDCLIQETGEYISNVQHYSNHLKYTLVPLSLRTVIKTMGEKCKFLKEIILQRCMWLSNRIIWLWTLHCPQLMSIDARHSLPC
ncbi:hypothetical protein BDF14DRAFT_1696001, partial [Spinellus fusiger]